MTPAISSFTAPAAPQAATPPAAPSQAKAFAQMLSQRQAMAQQAPKPDVAAASADEPAAPPKAATHPTDAAQAADRSSPRTEKAEKADKAHQTKAPHGSEPTEAAKTPGDEAAATDSEPADPALAEWLAALHLPVAPAPAPAPTPEATAAAAGVAVQADPTGVDTPAADARQGVHGTKAGGRGPLDAKAGNGLRQDPAQEGAERLHAARDHRDPHDKPAALAADAQASPSAWQAAVERTKTPTESQPRPEAAAIGALGAATQAAPAARTAEPALPVAINLPTPATAPEFAHSLGVQVSVLARDGIQQAELHLNPAEMGPISVQIALDGTQAQVNFGADSPATRQIIESGLPELAAALRDAGFTLSGGGVHSQARGRGEGGDGRDSSQSGGQGRSGATEVTPRRIGARVSAGGVDLYA